VKPITSHSSATPANAQTARAAESADAAAPTTISSLRRSKRSAAAPAHGVSTRMAANCEKLRTPSRSSEPVRR
jgi:hypothetical protein